MMVHSYLHCCCHIGTLYMLSRCRISIIIWCHGMSEHDAQDLIKKSIWNDNKKGLLLNLNLISLGVSFTIRFICICRRTLWLVVLLSFMKPTFFVLLVALYVAICWGFFFFFISTIWRTDDATEMRHPIWWVNRNFSRQVVWVEPRKVWTEQNGRNQILLLLWKVGIKVWFPELICFSTPDPWRIARSTVIPEIYLLY